MQIKSKIITPICFAIIFSSSAASAYSLKEHKWNPDNGAIKYQWGSNLTSPGTVIRNGFVSALVDWNSVPQFDLSFVEYPSLATVSLNSYYTVSSSDYGITNSYYSGSYFTDSFVLVNAGNTKITLANYARSVAGHELGHVLGLNHVSDSVQLMSQERDRGLIYTPQSDDINGVAALY